MKVWFCCPKEGRLVNKPDFCILINPHQTCPVGRLRCKIDVKDSYAHFTKITTAVYLCRFKYIFSYFST